MKQNSADAGVPFLGCFFCDWIVNILMQDVNICVRRVFIVTLMMLFPGCVPSNIYSSVFMSLSLFVHHKHSFQARKHILEIHTREWNPKLAEPFVDELAEKCVGKSNA